MWTRQREAGLPNVHITTQALLSKIVHKGGRGSKMSKKSPKICPHGLWSMGLIKIVVPTVMK